MHMICPPMPIPVSTQLTEFLYISHCKKITATSYSALLCCRPGHVSLAPIPRYWHDNIFCTSSNLVNEAKENY